MFQSETLQKTQKMPRGRPKKQITEDQLEHIERLASVLNTGQLAGFLGMCENTFRKLRAEDPRIDEAYKKGRSDAMAKVGVSLLKQALGGNTTAQIFYLKTQAGWRDKVEVEHSGSPEIVVRVVE